MKEDVFMRPNDSKFSFDSPHCSFDLAFGYGYTGSPDVVKAMALHADRTTKQNVLMGCQTGFMTGHFDNMQVFLATWVAEHLTQIKADKAEQGEDSWKKDTHTFVGGTALALLEKTKYPVETAKVLTLKMDDAARQETLDYLLRYAAARKKSDVVEALLAAGANANTMGGIAVKNALAEEPVDVLSLRALHKHGADFAKAAGTWSLDAAVVMDWDARLDREEATAAIDAFKQQVAELTATVETLQKKLQEYEGGKPAKPRKSKHSKPPQAPPAA